MLMQHTSGAEQGLVGTYKSKKRRATGIQLATLRWSVVQAGGEAVGPLRPEVGEGITVPEARQGTTGQIRCHMLTRRALGWELGSLA
jgi:hypothetical protein